MKNTKKQRVSTQLNFLLITRMMTCIQTNEMNDLQTIMADWCVSLVTMLRLSGVSHDVNVNDSCSHDGHIFKEKNSHPFLL